MSKTITVKLDRCGFCGARKNQPCREFGNQTTTHPERFVTLPDLFIEELDGITGETVEDARETQEAYDTYREESYAEGAWLRAAETNDQYRWEVEEDERRAAAWSF
jgi:hypothetical protein